MSDPTFKPLSDFIRALQAIHAKHGDDVEVRLVAQSLDHDFAGFLVGNRKGSERKKLFLCDPLSLADAMRNGTLKPEFEVHK